MLKSPNLVNVKTAHGFTLDNGRLEQIVLKVHRAAMAKRGIFEDGLGKYLPQWNLPEELEYNPAQRKPKDPEGAARFLWVRLFCDRLSSSKYLKRSGAILMLTGYTLLKKWLSTNLQKSNDCCAKDSNLQLKMEMKKTMEQDFSIMLKA